MTLKKETTRQNTVSRTGFNAVAELLAKQRIQIQNAPELPPDENKYVCSKKPQEASKQQKKRTMSPEARKNISDGAKRKWEARQQLAIQGEDESSIGQDAKAMENRPTLSEVQNSFSQSMIFNFLRTLSDTEMATVLLDLQTSAEPAEAVVGRLIAEMKQRQSEISQEIAELLERSKQLEKEAFKLDKQLAVVR